MLESLPLPAPQLDVATDALTPDADVVIVGLSENASPSGLLAEIDRTHDGWISRLIERGHVRGKKGDLTLVAIPGRGPAMMLVVGLGSDAPDRGLAFESASAAIRKLADRDHSTVVIALADQFASDLHDAIVAGTVYACEAQCIYQSDPSIHVPKSLLFASTTKQAIDQGKIIADSINQTRRLVNEPPAVLYPESFAQRAKQIAESVGIDVEIWDPDRLQAEGCRAMLAVGSGSSRPPYLLIMRYQGGGDELPVALVGKGVTFDSGGLSLKPSDAMADMKCDMAGAATVVGVMQSIASLQIPQNVIGLCGLAENMVSGNSYKLGDVIETRSGKTIEILNTDAEGRVVLADVLDVAVQQEPRAIVDLATLTGACMVALGTDVAGLMTNDQSVCDSIIAAANREREPVWQLPMFDLYNEKIKSKVADIKNVGEGRWAGAITAAKFLEQFVNDVPWVHIDIAGPAFADSPKPHRDGGATGAMVRTLIDWIAAMPRSETAGGKSK